MCHISSAFFRFLPLISALSGSQMAHTLAHRKALFMEIRLTKRPTRKGEKIYYTFEWGKGAGDRRASGIFIYSKPKGPIEKNHNKEALVILETKRSQLILERQATRVMKTITTGRSNNIITIIAVQDYSQLKLVYSREEAEVAFNIGGNVISGQVSGETAKAYYQPFPIIRQITEKEILENYLLIKQDIQDIVEQIMEDLLKDPEKENLIVKH